METLQFIGFLGGLFGGIIVFMMALARQFGDGMEYMNGTPGILLGIVLLVIGVLCLTAFTTSG